jgi:hypothetical protein
MLCFGLVVAQHHSQTMETILFSLISVAGKSTRHTEHSKIMETRLVSYILEVGRGNRHPNTIPKL